MQDMPPPYTAPVSGDEGNNMQAAYPPHMPQGVQPPQAGYMSHENPQSQMAYPQNLQQPMEFTHQVHY